MKKDLIRPAKYNDFETIKQIFGVAFDEEYKQRGVDIVQRISKLQQFYPVLKVLAIFPNPYQHIFNVYVYEQEEKVIGLIQISPRNKEQTQWHIENIAVLPDYRGRGIAHDLINYVCETYGKKGALRFTLEVDIKNKSVIKLYESLGFRHYCTVYYYRLPVSKATGKLPENISLPFSIRPYKSSDCHALFDLYMASIPVELRTVEQRVLADFQENTFEYFYKHLKEQLKYSGNEHLVIENPKNKSDIIASLTITAQYRKLPHVIRVLIHPAYNEMLTEKLINYAISYLSKYPPRQILIAALEQQKEKRNALETLNFKHITADYMMVRDNLLILKLPQKENVVSLEGQSALKPLFKQHE